MITLKEYIINESKKIPDKLIKLAKLITKTINEQYEKNNTVVKIEEFLKKFANTNNPDITNFKKFIDLDVKIFKYELKQYNKNLYILYYNSPEDKFQHCLFDNINSFKKEINHEHDGIIMVAMPFEKLNRTVGTIAHELRHAYDEIFCSNEEKETFATYDGEDVGKYDNFLYLISPTEQNAYFIDFKESLNNKIGDYIIKKYNEFKCTNFDDFIQKITKENQNKNFIKKIFGKLFGEKLNQSLQFLTYKYYILNNEETFKKFISKYSKDEQTHLIKKLSVLVKDKTKDKEDINNIYKSIMETYNHTYNKYKELIINYIKKATH